MLKLLQFSGAQCAPCQKIKPIINELLEDMENIELVLIDAENQPDLTREYKIRSIPTLVLLNDEKVVKILFGLKNKSEIKEFLNVD